MPMMSKTCLKSSLFATPIFIYSEAGGIFWGGGGGLVFLHGPRNLDAKDYRNDTATDNRMVRSSLL